MFYQLAEHDCHRSKALELDSVAFPVCKNRVRALEQLQSCTTTV